MNYLFTQCESISCRSVAPMQDTPAVKATYEASVIVQGYVAKMSANDTGNQAYNSSHHVFYFHN